MRVQRIVRQRTEGGRPWECTLFDAGPAARGHVLYYFHAHSGNIDTWQRANAPLREELQRNSIAITVISISFGPRWFLVPKNQSPTSGLYSVFSEEIVPLLEKLVTQPIRRRSAIGYSMGGYNVFQLLSRNPGFLADAALVSPAILPVSPYADQSEIQAFIARTDRVSRGWKDRWLQLWGRETMAKGRVETIFAAHGQSLPDLPSWNEATPLLRMANFRSEQAPRLYISCGKNDEFGFFEVSETIANVAKGKQIDTTWVPLAGGHGVNDFKSLAKFLGEGHGKIAP